MENFEGPSPLLWAARGCLSLVLLVCVAVIALLIMSSPPDPRAEREKHAIKAAKMEWRLGPDHLQTLAAKHSLAIDMAYLNDYAAAGELFAQLVEARERTLGPDHPVTAEERNGLAMCLASLGASRPHGNCTPCSSGRRNEPWARIIQTRSSRE
ncbi:MAG: tetratricopeptide repeat protein [Deltaproteobacteria bacterium]|jgi:hypothetical protein|nr:tetratricopeptide repeat protein [Deltaproteobacteria bacterium]